MKKLRVNAETVWGLFLLTTLIFSIFILPLLPDAWQAQSSRIAFTILFVSAVFSIETRRRYLLTISVLAMCMEWIAGIFSLEALTVSSKLLNIVFFLIIVVILIKQVATSQQVNMKVILGSVIGYLLLGLIYSIFVNYIMVRDPLAFNIPQTVAVAGDNGSHLDESIYFSFVSLATLGYGDILPIKPYARSLAIWITISGQLYIAIIIALLVGKFASVHRD